MQTGRKNPSFLLSQVWQKRYIMQQHLLYYLFHDTVFKPIYCLKGDDQTAEGCDALPDPMPVLKSNHKDPPVTIYLDDDDVPILPPYNPNDSAKDLQLAFRAFIKVHYCKPTTLVVGWSD